LRSGWASAPFAPRGAWRLPAGALARVVVVSAAPWAPAFSIGGFVLLIALLQPGG
jgi:hypothetical protein